MLEHQGDVWLARLFTGQRRKKKIDIWERTRNRNPLFITALFFNLTPEILFSNCITNPNFLIEHFGSCFNTFFYEVLFLQNLLKVAGSNLRSQFNPSSI